MEQIKKNKTIIAIIVIVLLSFVFGAYIGYQQGKGTSKPKTNDNGEVIEYDEDGEELIILDEDDSEEVEE